VRSEQPLGTSRRASDALDAARAALIALAERAPAGPPADETRRVAMRASDLLVWAGSWLDEPYRPAVVATSSGPADLSRTLRRLDELTRAFEELVESFEDDDPVANANGVQTGSLAFAIVGDALSRLRRLGGAGTGGA